MNPNRKVLESIEVPLACVDQVIAQAIEEAQHHMDQQQKRRKRMQRVGMVAAMVLMLFGAGFVSPSMAKIWAQIPYIGSIFEHFADNRLQHVPKEEVLVIEGGFFSREGIALKIQEVFYDENSISIGYVMYGESLHPSEITLNLQTQEGPLYGGGHTLIDEVSEGVYYSVTQLYYEADLPSELMLEIMFYEGFDFDQEPLFHYRVPVEKSVNAQNQTIRVMENVHQHGETLRIESIKISPTATQVQYLLFSQTPDVQHEIKLIDGQGHQWLPYSRGGSGFSLEGVWIEEHTAIFESVEDITQIEKIQLIIEKDIVMEVMIADLGI